MPTIGLLIIAVLLPTGVASAWVGARWAWDRYRRSRPPLPDTRPIASITADLRRLHDLLETTENATGLPSKHLRCTATRAAYVDALTQACRRLEVPAPTPRGSRLPSQAEIYRVEAALRNRGLDVRPVA